VTDIYTQIKEIIKITLKSVKDKINSNKNKFNFELFGYDFIVDSDFKVYLLEVNTNPGIDDSSPWIMKIIPRMIDDALRLTVDDIFDSENANKVENIYKTPFPIDGYPNSDNLWDYLLDLNIQDEVKLIKKKKK